MGKDSFHYFLFVMSSAQLGPKGDGVVLFARAGVSVHLHAMQVRLTGNAFGKSATKHVEKGFVAHAKSRHTRKHNSIHGGLRFAAPRHQQPEGVDETVVDNTCNKKSVDGGLRFAARCQRQPVINMMRAKTKQRKMHFGRTMTFHRHCNL